MGKDEHCLASTEERDARGFRKGLVTEYLGKLHGFDEGLCDNAGMEDLVSKIKFYPWEGDPKCNWVDYLQSYLRSLRLDRTYTIDEIIKGKMPAMETEAVATNREVVSSPWPPPPADQAALSVDGAFSPADGSAAAGMVLRRHDGSVIFAAYRFLFNCNDALEAELHAIMQGMALALQHCSLPIVVQSDSSVAISSMIGEGLSRSAYGHLVNEIKHLMVDREFIPLKIKREQNRVADRLACYSRMECTTAVWLGRGPPCVEDILPLDCNPMLME